MQELVEHLVRALVDHPDQVQVRQVEGERTVMFEVKVAPDDMGKVIGRQGRTANALRTLVSAAAMKQRRRATLEILDPVRDRDRFEGTQ
ncbi:MAG: KH domain-containing protein [Armatimonadota bacterium]